MTSAARIEANRRNAAHSTGPRTDAGKARSRLNAMKHGQRAVTILPVVPHEDPKALARRVQEWTDDFQPATAIERDLIAAAARLLWAHERIEHAEAAGLSQRIRAAKEEDAEVRAREVGEFGTDLFSLGWTGSEYVHRTRSGQAPAALVARLESNTEGCRWLLLQWAEQRRALDRDAAWTPIRLARLVRLLGNEGRDAVRDEGLNATILAVDVLKPGLARRFWEATLTGLRLGEHTLEEPEPWCELAPRPAAAAAAREALSALIDERTRRLEDRIAEHEAESEAEKLEWAQAAAFEHGAELAPLHRYRSARHRELIRTVELLRKLRQDPPPPEPELEDAPNEPAAEGSQASVEWKVTSPSADAPDDERSHL